MAEHIMEFDAHGWAIEHPDECKQSEAGMLGCKIHRAARYLDECPVDEFGRYYVSLDRDGEINIVGQVSAGGAAGPLEPEWVEVDHRIVEEITRLRARLAEVEAERDEAKARLVSHLVWCQFKARAETAEARLAAVLALCDQFAVVSPYAGEDFKRRVRATARGEGDQ